MITRKPTREEIIKAYKDVPRVYAHLRATAPSDVEKLGWLKVEWQQQNFQLMIDMLRDIHAPLPGLTLHDAGCGTGDLLTFLQKTEQEPRHYIGTDFTDESLDVARQRFPSHNFLRCDLWSNLVIPKTDVTLTLGTLAYHKPRVVEDILNNLWDNTSCALGFNTWWDLPSHYLYAENISQLRKCINRFLRGKQVHQQLGTTYGQPTEAVVMVYR